MNSPGFLSHLCLCSRKHVCAALLWSMTPCLVAPKYRRVLLWWPICQEAWGKHSCSVWLSVFVFAEGCAIITLGSGGVWSGCMTLLVRALDLALSVYLSLFRSGFQWRTLQEYSSLKPCYCLWCSLLPTHSTGHICRSSLHLTKCNYLEQHVVSWMTTICLSTIYSVLFK